MIQATNLTKAYNGVTVLNIQISLSLTEKASDWWEITVLENHFFRLILDLIAATTGEVLIEGESSS